MSHYPEAVEKIIQDYLQRVAIQLKRFPNSDQKEVLKELGSHIYESYCAESDSEPDFAGPRPLSPVLPSEL